MTVRVLDTPPRWLPRRWRLRTDRVRVYEVVRSAHLERARSFEPADLLYRRRRYDFDPALAVGCDVRHASFVDIFMGLTINSIATVEINEPLQLSGLPGAVVAITAARLGGLFRGRQPTIGAYAIENKDPFDSLPPRLRSRVRRRIERSMAAWVTARTDRMIFGTPGSAKLYEDRFGSRLPRDTEMVPALPSACRCVAGSDCERVRESVLFVGALQDRKGIQQLLDAWKVVESEAPGASLMIIGKGPRERDVREFAADHRSVDFVNDPPRDRIHQELKRHAVLILLSQPTPTWREQVGLPIVEGLAHGCKIVTTTETGLTDWLAGHGHLVINPAAPTTQTAAAIVEAMRTTDPSAVLAALPATDGRLSADDQLMRHR